MREHWALHRVDLCLTDIGDKPLPKLSATCLRVDTDALHQNRIDYLSVALPTNVFPNCEEHTASPSSCSVT
jgi:hypothetical protein